MMKQTLIKFTLLLTSVILVSYSYAQVTIGNNEKAEPGALLQLTNRPISNSIGSTDITSDLGLMLPRIALKSRTNYSNVFETIQSSSTGKIWNAGPHTGLTIYNTTLDLSKGLCPGAFVWEGASWEKLGVECDGYIGGGTGGSSQNTLVVESSEFVFYSGLGTPPQYNYINQKNTAIKWTPTSYTVNVTKSGSVINYNNLKTTYSSPIGEDRIIVEPTALNPSLISADPFYSVTEQLVVTLMNSSTPILTRNITVTQVHKNILVTKEGPNTLIVKSNAPIRYSTSTNSLLATPTSPIGSEMNSGSWEIRIPYNPQIGNNEITFEDAQYPKRFPDFRYTEYVSTSTTGDYINVNKDTFTFYTGENISSTTTDNLTVMWRPTSNSVTVDKTNLFSTNMLPTTLTSGGLYQLYNFKPEPFSASVVASNPFYSSTENITFRLNSTSLSKTITIKQVNKAMIVTPNSTDPSKVTVVTNSRFQYTSPTGSIIGTAAYYPANDGSEREDGLGTTYSIQLASTVGDHSVTFSDSNNPKRFSDYTHTYTIASPPVNVTPPSSNQCVTIPGTMKDYLNIWYTLYCPDGNCPEGSNGTSTNQNSVQYHYDQDGNVFFSAMFGGKRWMVTNLATTKDQTGKFYNYRNILDDDNRIRGAYHYPNSASLVYTSPTSGAATAANLAYNNNKKLGLLYNYLTANPSDLTWIGVINNPFGFGDICPQGWSLPSNSDFDQLLTNVASDPTKYANLPTGTLYYPETAKFLQDNCSGVGLSKPFILGGFDFPLAGMYNPNTQSEPPYEVSVTDNYFYNTYGAFWTKSRLSGSKSNQQGRYAFLLESYPLNAGVLYYDKKKLDGNTLPENGLSVRCIKD